MRKMKMDDEIETKFGGMNRERAGGRTLLLSSLNEDDDDAEGEEEKERGRDARLWLPLSLLSLHACFSCCVLFTKPTRRPSESRKKKVRGSIFIFSFRACLLACLLACLFSRLFYFLAFLPLL